MEPTSEERRKVAERLRGLDVHDWNDFDDEIVSLESAIECNVGQQFESQPWWHRLADLIEPPEITEDTSEGYHTFAQLYYQRMMLFAVLVQEHIDRAWKTRRHEDGELCFGGGWFLVAIDTPVGTYGYHYEEKYWYMFGCDELPKAKPWDGYDERDVGRLMSLVGEPRSSQQERTCVVAEVSEGEYGLYYMLSCGHTLMTDETDGPSYCPNCGARVVD